MSRTGGGAVQTAVLTRLRADATLATSLKGGILDDVPQAPNFDYAVYDSPLEIPERTFGEDGQICYFTIAIFTRSSAPTRGGVGAMGYLRGRQIAEQMIGLLMDENTPLVVVGHAVRDVDVETLESFREEGTREADGIRRTELSMRVELEG